MGGEGIPPPHHIRAARAAIAISPRAATFFIGAPQIVERVPALLKPEK